ncbi:hypothetical protein FHT12_001459 [Xanthomonas campestris]|nr:hypothetical protein [Xanthomonas euroxanthea]
MPGHRRASFRPVTPRNWLAAGASGPSSALWAPYSRRAGEGYAGTPTRWRPARYSRELARRRRIKALIRPAGTFSRRAGEGFAGEPTRQLPARHSGRMTRRFGRPPILVSPSIERRGSQRRSRCFGECGVGALEKRRMRSAEADDVLRSRCGALQKRMTCFGAGEALWRSRMMCFEVGEALWTSRIMCFGAGEALWKSRMMRFGAGEALWTSRMTCFGTGDALEKAGDVLSSG